MLFGRKKTEMPNPGSEMAGRSEAIDLPNRHFVNGNPIMPPFPDGTETAYFGMGCFWGAERVFWRIPGVYSTAVGYAGGSTPNPTYQEVCTGRTGHTEAVMVAFDPSRVSYESLLKAFWEEHDPTQGMRQGNDRGTQYRSAIYWTTTDQQAAAEASRSMFHDRLSAAGLGALTPEVAGAGAYYYAEEYHQQYLAKNLAGAGVDIQEFYFGEVPAPRKATPVEGYCSMEPTGVSCPIGRGVPLEERTAEG